jgi:hypothetical protein
MSNLRSDAAPVAIVLTDGSDNASDEAGMGATPTAAFDSLMRFIEPIKSEVSIYTISLGNYTNASQLTRLAQVTGGSYFLAVESKQLTEIYKEISNVMIVGVGARDINVVETIPPQYSYIPGSMVPGPDNNTTIKSLEVLENGGRLRWSANVVAMWGLLQVRYKIFVPSQYAGASLDTALTTRLEYADNNGNEDAIVLGGGPETVDASRVEADAVSSTCRVVAAGNGKGLRVMGLGQSGPQVEVAVVALNGRMVFEKNAEISTAGEAVFDLPASGRMPAGLYVLIIKTANRHLSLPFCHRGR